MFLHISLLAKFVVSLHHIRKDLLIFFFIHFIPRNKTWSFLNYLFVSFSLYSVFNELRGSLQNLSALLGQTATFSPGGDDGNRTHYLLNAIQALSQVSYAPVKQELLSNPRKLNNESINLNVWVAISNTLK